MANLHHAKETSFLSRNGSHTGVAIIVDRRCRTLEETLASIPRTNDIKLVLEDFSSMVGKTDRNDGYYKIVDSHGLGARNERS